LRIADSRSCHALAWVFWLSVMSLRSNRVAAPAVVPSHQR
jgi:hypothetical protein